jgi:hypothetical protein
VRRIMGNTRLAVAIAPFIVALTALVSSARQEENPPAAGFDARGSDAKAVAIADEVMNALGGRKAWDGTRFLTWKFFGRRTHVWDKLTGDLRFENGDALVLMNLVTRKGRVWKSGQEVSDPAELAKALDETYGTWINDSYWMFMPYKMKDSGVTLKYVGKEATAAGAPADVVELTFANVGRTPENKYHVYVDEKTRLVTQWDYYPKATDAEPMFKLPWLDWERHGAILLSANRGERQHENVGVLEGVPASVFQSPAPVDLAPFFR